MRLGFFTVLILISAKSFSSDSLLITQLFNNLLNKQIYENDFFVKGSFTSFRQHNTQENLKADNNIFFTALIAYTLQELKPLLLPNEKVIADTIINKAKIAFTFYNNKKGRLSYNFWKTVNGCDFFPNDKILNKLKYKLALPDDLDDTGIILAASAIADSTAQKAHLSMQQFVNGKYSTIKNTYKKYKNTTAYSTWYGVKMPIDFDFGVHCNILSFVNKYNLPWTKADSATYTLLINMVDDGLYTKSPTYISPYYGSPAVLIYHLGRLMQTKTMEELENRKPILVKNALNELQLTNNILDKVILSSTLLKWNATIPNFDLNLDVVDGNLNTTDFVYYTGHLFGHLGNTIKKIANSIDATQYKWYCSAFNDCLLLEYLILKHRKKQ